MTINVLKTNLVSSFYLLGLNFDKNLLSNNNQIIIS